MKRCCVIGGCGFIGSHLVELLLEMGRDVTIIDTMPALKGGWTDKVKYLRNESGDKRFLKNALKNIDEVVDLAYSTFPKTSFEDPLRDISANLPFGVNLFQAASEVSIHKIIIMSSGGTVYGEPIKLPIAEDHPTNPISPYGITKLAIEKYALMFHCLNKLPVIILRAGNAFGEGQKPFRGQGFISTAMASILQRKEITLFGKNGTVRDYIYVKDIAYGIISALDRGIPGSCYNLGSGIGLTNRDVLDEIHPLARSMGFTPKTVIMPFRKFDVSVNVLNSTKLADETGWRLRTSFKNGIKKTWEWFYQEYKLT